MWNKCKNQFSKAIDHDQQRKSAPRSLETMDVLLGKRLRETRTFWKTRRTKREVQANIKEPLEPLYEVGHLLGEDPTKQPAAVGPRTGL